MNKVIADLETQKRIENKKSEVIRARNGHQKLEEIEIELEECREGSANYARLLNEKTQECQEKEKLIEGRDADLIQTKKSIDRIGKLNVELEEKLKSLTSEVGAEKAFRSSIEHILNNDAGDMGDIAKIIDRHKMIHLLMEKYQPFRES